MANSSFLATAAQGKYVLTVLDNHDLAGAERLAGLNTELWRRSVPTSEVVPSLAGTRVTDMHGRPTVLKRWLPGRTLEELPVALLRPAGRLLAQLHRTRSDGLRLPIGTRRLSDAHLRAIDTFPDQDFAQWLRRHLKRSPRMDGTRRRHCFVHGDFHADNIVVRPDGSLAILDWETATVDDPLLDIGMALVGHARVGEALSQERAGEFIVGYREAGDLEDGDLRQLPRAVQHAALIIAFHRYHRHNVRFPDMAKAQMFREMMDIADVAEQLSFTV